MLKSLVAQIASQSVAIILQQKREAGRATFRRRDRCMWPSLEEECRLKIAECQVLEAKLRSGEPSSWLSPSQDRRQSGKGQLKEKCLSSSRARLTPALPYENGEW